MPRPSGISPTGRRHPTRRRRRPVALLPTMEKAKASPPVTRRALVVVVPTDPAATVAAAAIGRPISWRRSGRKSIALRADLARLRLTQKNGENANSMPAGFRFHGGT